MDSMSDAEMMDSIDYTLFPNFHPWGAFNRIVYRFRPNGDDHRSSIMECIFLAPYKKGQKPDPAQAESVDDMAVDPALLGVLSGEVAIKDYGDCQPGEFYKVEHERGEIEY